MYSGAISALVESVVSQNGMKDGIELLKEVLAEGRLDFVRLVIDLGNAVEDMCLEKSFCYGCVEYAEPRKEKEGRPYGDSIVEEDVIYMVCPICGEEIE
jgi:hypothetical protein